MKTIARLFAAMALGVAGLAFTAAPAHAEEICYVIHEGHPTLEQRVCEDHRGEEAAPPPPSSGGTATTTRSTTTTKKAPATSTQPKRSATTTSGGQTTVITPQEDGTVRVEQMTLARYVDCEASGLCA